MALPTLTYAVTSTGLSLPTQAQLLAYYQSAFLDIYGVDVTQQDASSPDNQFINIMVQAAIDTNGVITQVFNGFDPDLALGVVVDMRCAINGIQRQVGTFSVVNIDLTISGSVNLYGLNQTAQQVYTVADNAGNQWQLVNTALGATTGTYVFQSATPGAVIAIPNSITVPVTVVLGVSTINNPTSQSTLGEDEETDYELKIRRQKSVSIPSQGYLAGLIAALLNISGVNYAQVYENNTGSTDSKGIPAHSIWVIVSGGAAADVADAIYTKRNAGCGMKGTQSYNITQINGSTFTVYWDNVVEEPLFIKFNVASLNGTIPPNISAISSTATGLQSTFAPDVNAEVNINQIGTLVQALDSNTLVTSPGFSDGTVQTITFSGVAASGTFKLSYGASSTAAISWNDAVGTIQTKLRALSGLGSITVSGSIASQSLVVTMTGVTTPSLIGYNTNSLQTSAPAPITLNFLSAYTNTLSTTLSNNQFEVLATNIIILPMMLTAAGVAYTISSGVVTGTTISLSAGAVLTFTGQGGYGTLTYSISTSTGGAINSSSGAYTAGTAGTDTLKVTDSMGNTATCTVTVT